VTGVSRSLLAGIEGGGTKFVCGLADLQLNTVTTATISTRTPAETLDDVVAFFRANAPAGSIAALGIASFGPVDVNDASPTYGRILATPKPGWSHVPIVQPLGERLGVAQISIETDVTAAALAEHVRGAARGLRSSAYVTIGTGIGAGFVQDGRPLRTMLHPEFGHIRIPHNRAQDPYEGCCPFHGDCLEGLASGPAVEHRWNQRPSDLPDDHPAWTMEADYVAHGLVNMIFTVCPQRIVIGGGIGLRLNWTYLRSHVRRLLGDYLSLPELTDRISDYIVPPALGDAAGLTGAFILAQQALEGNRVPR
jgi:fructokinase